MREIKASTRVTGKRREASIEAAKRKVNPDALYLIRRHGAFFRPGAHGYVTDIAGAGVFNGKTARGYLSVKGLSVVPTPSRPLPLCVGCSKSPLARPGPKPLKGPET